MTRIPFVHYSLSQTSNTLLLCLAILSQMFRCLECLLASRILVSGMTVSSSTWTTVATQQRLQSRFKLHSTNCWVYGFLCSSPCLDLKTGAQGVCSPKRFLGCTWMTILGAVVGYQKNYCCQPQWGAVLWMNRVRPSIICERTFTGELACLIVFSYISPFTSFFQV